MGCASSKRIEADVVDVYRPPPSSFAVFDVTSIEEPWLKSAAAPDGDSNNGKPSPVPNPILEKLNAIEDAPRSWNEVSKALEDLKPNLKAAAALPPPPPPDSSPNKAPAASPSANRRTPRKSFSFHTLEELESKISPQKTPESGNRVDAALKPELRRFHSTRTESKTNPNSSEAAPKSIKDNIFILRDREERAKEGKSGGPARWDPLADFPEICPPGGAASVVMYTTSLGGVRRTHEDCIRLRQVMEAHHVAFDERDVALDGGYLAELRGLLGSDVSLPRVFVKGRYLGGAEEVVDLNETGRLARILAWARVERGPGRLGCGGCGGARFVPCLACSGSCRVVGEDGSKERCGECNENGLVHCLACV
ncbi:glutaredoxin family protein [Striga asiatica]|uniref:Glutaredoxin family protein n=1 Tax=Striga asiatica TaxID=4170 RepID=A0A5A7P1Y0_STRAF|nr:glutaredoxin family protein [Striga asiatica]